MFSAPYGFLRVVKMTDFHTMHSFFDCYTYYWTVPTIIHELFT